MDSDEEAFQTIRQHYTPCPICLNSVAFPPAATSCKHQFCYQCIRKWCQSSNLCPQCRSPVEHLRIEVGQMSSLKEAMADGGRSCCLVRYFHNWKLIQLNSFTETIPEVVTSDTDNEDSFVPQICMVCSLTDGQERIMLCWDCHRMACHPECDWDRSSRWRCWICRS